RCAPGANAMTKEILMSAGNTVPDSVLDQAARAFSAAIRGDEGSEGTAAFAEKRKPRWAAR
ncbi:MAG: enoyl-CoA hydratase/isomerase family protein, partial [Gammaproteobacteria bacterium]|nr:enoyl-CoA hydratase/isomerase family protein [Gammaproteobacteria bacterium]